MTGKNCDSGKYKGPGAHRSLQRTVPKGAHGSTKLDTPTNLGSILISATTELFERIADKTLTVRRITIAANRVVKDEGFFQVDLFTDTTKLEKEKKTAKCDAGSQEEVRQERRTKRNQLSGWCNDERKKSADRHATKPSKEGRTWTTRTHQGGGSPK